MTRIEGQAAKRVTPLPSAEPAPAPSAAAAFELMLAAMQLELARALSGSDTGGDTGSAMVQALTLQAPPVRIGMQPPAAAAPSPRAIAASPAPVGSTQARFVQMKPLFQEAEQATGVPWQIQAAQWALETGWGTATPRDVATGQESYNLFGVKGTGSQGSVKAATTEVEHGRTVNTVAEFRAYGSLAESVLDHARLLASPYYAPAHASGKDLQAWTEQLGPQHLGYATDPQYSQKLWRIITENGWDQ